LPGLGTDPGVAPNTVKAGLTDDTKAAPAAGRDVCAGVTLSRNVKYGDSERNVLDVATTADKVLAPRPVLLFVAAGGFPGGRGARRAAGAGAVARGLERSGRFHHDLSAGTHLSLARRRARRRGGDLMDSPEHRPARR